MNEDEISLKPCPFCGAKMEAFILRSKVNPNYWANEHWFLRDNHDEKCFRIDRADYLMFCHLLEASIPAVEQTYITVNERTEKIDKGFL